MLGLPLVPVSRYEIPTVVSGACTSDCGQKPHKFMQYRKMKQWTRGDQTEPRGKTHGRADSATDVQPEFLPGTAH
jgi:hypothetical protein